MQDPRCIIHAEHRRQPARLLKIGGASALLGASASAFPAASSRRARAPRSTKAMLGYIALTDAAPLIIAKEKGLFAKHGMPDVDVAKQASWGATRDNLVLGGASERHRRRAHPDADALPDLAPAR